MVFVFFTHSLVSDWNHGNAHFLRGVATELIYRGHEVRVFEPANGWSRQQLVADAGAGAIARFRSTFPALRSHAVDLETLSIDRALDRADVVVVHEWNPHSVVARIGRHRARGGRYALLFHDTHHRSVTNISAMAGYDLDGYDGVLAFGDVIRQRYLSFGWARRAWTWHEAADTRLFKPASDMQPDKDLIWIGNWGDDERSAEIQAYLIEPARDLRLRATIHGVRYPESALRLLREAGIRHEGWLANYDAPQAYAQHRMTVHIPRRPYVLSLPGIPTIRVFEALACGVPLVSTPWHDAEQLFTPGEDYLVAGDPSQMRTHLAALCADDDLRRSLIEHGLATIRRRHTCAHRVDELMAIVRQVRGTAIEEAVSA
jgi:spore maturation protein CgeB